jgi:hypothetical protein
MTMATTIMPQEPNVDGASKPHDSAAIATVREAQASCVTTEQIWRELARASFAVLSHVTPSGAPRSSGVVYTIVGRHLYVAVAPDSWKAKQIPIHEQVAVTVPIRRGGPLSLIASIPPATISFHGTAVIHSNGWQQLRSQLTKMEPLLPPERRTNASIVEIIPEGRFITYGLGVSLMQMRNPAIAAGHAAVS